jgi:hypothetical protein
MYKKGKTYYSVVLGYNVTAILKRKRFLGIPYWGLSHGVKDGSHIQEVIDLLNNPAELQRRLNIIKKQIQDARNSEI